MAIVLPQVLIQELERLGKAPVDRLDAIAGQAVSEQKEFVQLLLEQNLLTAKDLLDIEQQLYSLPVIDLASIELKKEILQEISEQIVGFYKIIPFAREGDTLKIGIVNPEDINALEALKFIATDKGLKLEKYLIGIQDFQKAFSQYRSLSGEVGKALESIIAEQEQTVESKKEKQKLGNEEITAESPVSKIVAATLKHAVESRTSDIHIEPFADRVRIRFRVDGVLVTTLVLPKNLHSAVVTRIKILSDLKIDETRLAQDGRFSTNFGDRKVDYRVSTLPTRNGEKVVMRILDPLANQVDLPKLGLEGQPFEILQRAMQKPFGSILITGPTGSGKSTTIAGMLKTMNTEDVNIVTLEDPIEYFIDGVNQSQIHEEIGYTFASGLRHILRQDPDVIMVGEIRDRETAALATQAALTGHIVLSTLHTNDALGVIPRLIDMGVERYLIAPTVNVAAAQRLLRRLCQTCRIETKANDGEAVIITKALKLMPKEYQDQYLAESYTIWKPNLKGGQCKECGGKAFKGRVGIFEMLEMNEQLGVLILSDLSEAALKAEADRQHMISMFGDGVIKVLKGVASLDELLDVAQAGDSA